MYFIIAESAILFFMFRMTQLELMIFFRDKKQNFGFLGPDCTVAKIKDAALTIMSAYRLGSSSHILLNVTNPENKLKIVLDLNFGLKCLVALHKRLGARVIEV